MSFTTQNISNQTSAAVNQSTQSFTAGSAQVAQGSTLLTQGSTAYALTVANNNSQPRVSETTVTFKEDPVTLQGGHIQPGPLNLPNRGGEGSGGTIGSEPPQLPRTVTVPGVDSGLLGLSQLQAQAPELRLSSQAPTLQLGVLTTTPEGQSQIDLYASVFKYLETVVAPGFYQMQGGVQVVLAGVPTPDTPSSGGQGG